MSNFYLKFEFCRKLKKKFKLPAWRDHYTSHVVALVEFVADMVELDSIQSDIEEHHSSAVDPAERLPGVDKCNLVMFAVTSEHLERMWAVAPLYTTVVEPNEDDRASVRRKKK